MQRFAIIVAGGVGKRMGGPTPKQFLQANGVPLLVHTLKRFHSFDPSIKLIVVMAVDWMEHWEELLQRFDVPKHGVLSGGEERFHSVQRGLQAIESNGVVAIHDAVRPLVSLQTLERCYTEAEREGNAIPTVPVVESLRRIDRTGNHAVDRSAYRIVQTPQCFHLTTLKEAFEAGFHPTFTDDASVFEKAGHQIHLVEGNAENIKVTNPADLLLAERLLKESQG